MSRNTWLETLMLSFIVAAPLAGCDGDETTTGPVCGNALCEAGEDAQSCAVDCEPCGNGVVDDGEDCDGSDLAGATCLTQGADGGELACTASCSFDTSACCTDACAAQGDTQCNGDVVESCEPDADGCLAWTEQVDCAATSMICDDQGGAMCITPCTDDCPTAGEQQCNADTIEECQVNPADGCNDWVQIEDCTAASEYCNDTTGTPFCCADACPTLGEQQCSADWTAIEICDAGAEGCSEWLVDQACGAGETCQTDGTTYQCLVPGGDTCTDPIPLQTGIHDITWNATGLDYLTTLPGCVPSSYSIDGPDVVMSYTATVNGYLDFLVLNKPVNTRWVLLVASSACGDLSAEEACISEWAPTEMGDTISVTAGTTYWFYIADTSSGTNPLSNPFTLSLTEIDCATFSATAQNLTPADAVTDVQPNATLTVDFDAAIDTTQGIITVTGDGGTNLSYDLSTTPAELTWSNSDHTLTIDPGVNFALGETITVSWSGLLDALCGTAVNPPTWSFQIVTTVPPGEDCSDPIVLTAGSNQYPWWGGNADYFTAVPCGTSTVDGPDIVGSFTASVNGYATITLQKPASNRMLMVVYAGACGDTTVELACISDYTPTTLEMSFIVQAGQTYYIYFMDTASGTAALPNPLDVTIVETDCTPMPAPVASNPQPPNGATTSSVSPVLTVDFDQPMLTNMGTVTLTGDISTNLTFDLTTSPPEIAWLNGDQTLEITPGLLQPGENVTITWSGLVDAICGKPAAVIPWTVTIITPPCFPGTGGMVGTTQTTVPSLITTTSSWFVEADADPAGWVYVGGTTMLTRTAKDGSVMEDVEVAAGLTTSQLGYAMLINGPDIFLVESKTTGTTGHLWRISSDGGVSWVVEDFATFPAQPNDDFRSVTLHNGRIYLATAEGTATNGTEIWSVSASPASIPDTAFYEGNVANEANCSALAADDSFFYLACSTGDKVIRVAQADAPSFVSTLVTDAIDASSTVNSLYSVDSNTDGLADFLYIHGWEPTIWFTCDPGGATPYTGVLTNVGSVDYGMGFDRVANALWMYDDISPYNLVRIE